MISVAEWIGSISKEASLMDLVVPGGGAEIPDERASKRTKGGASSTASGVFTEYLDANVVKDGLAMGKFIKGGLRTSRYNPFEAHVLNEATGDSVLLSGRAAMNRAIDGDLVAVEILPESEWVRPGSRLVSETVTEPVPELETEPEPEPMSEPVSEPVSGSRSGSVLRSTTSTFEPPERTPWTRRSTSTPSPCSCGPRS